MTSAIAARYKCEGPKRILSLDGGGTRGIVTLCFLEEIEATLRKKLGRPDLVLSDYFDLIGGTSVGSMIATLLATGKDVAYVRNLFEAWAPRIFDPASWGVVDHMYDARVLRGLVQTEVFDWPLGSEKIKTGLCIVAKRADTGSIWPIVNNPAGPYFASRPGVGNTPIRKGNADYKLLDLIRASTAAPRYFSPAHIGIFEGVDDYGNPSRGQFVDGGVSPHNNPALQLFMMAGITGYNLGGGALEPRGERRAWKLGADNLLIVSVGTGSYEQGAERSRVAALEAVFALQGMIADGQELGLTLLQWMSVPARSWHVDRVVGDLSHDLLGDGAGLQQPLLSFHRYDVRLDEAWLSRAENVGASMSRESRTQSDLKGMQDFTNAAAIAPLARLATDAAKIQVDAAHFPAAFDQIWSIGRAIG